MSTLEALKERIDGGEVAELPLLRPIRIGRDAYDGTITTVFRNATGYVWSLYRKLDEERIRTRYEQYGPEWQHLLKRIEGEQTISHDWIIRPRDARYEQ
ncbi:MAG TPA: hypothetical protein VFB12_18130 [Ktedonobacteraceae bacterium]|nr:hypothetical protein [Ktedonobacteraceae bacterium]